MMIVCTNGRAGERWRSAVSIICTIVNLASMPLTRHPKVTVSLDGLCMRRMQRWMYTAGTERKSTHMSMGGGGQSRSHVGMARHIAAVAGAAVALEGKVWWRARRRGGTRGEVVQRTRGIHEAMSISNTSGKLIQVCWGQHVGFLASSMLKTSALVMRQWLVLLNLSVQCL